MTGLQRIDREGLLRMDVTIIQTKRLDLIPMRPDVLRAALSGDRGGMGQLLGVSVPPDWEVRRDALELRLQQIEADPSLQPWMIRGISLRRAGVLIGDIGCHSAPFEPPAPLQKSVEIGYGVLKAHRRHGFAEEAIKGLMQWACDQHHVRRFVLSISPENHPSQALAGKLGFQKIGSQIDEADGLEEILEKCILT